MGGRFIKPFKQGKKWYTVFKVRNPDGSIPGTEYLYLCIDKLD